MPHLLTCFLFDQRKMMSAGKALEKLEEVSLTCQNLENAIKRLESQAQVQKEGLDCVKSSCKQIIETLKSLLVKQLPTVVLEVSVFLFSWLIKHPKYFVCCETAYTAVE